MSESTPDEREFVPRAEFEALRERVEALEAMVEDGSVEGGSGGLHPGLDHRDEAVIEALDVGKGYHPRSIVRAYLNQTDITNKSTAKNRARQLRKRFFDGDTFQGVGEDE